MTNQIEKIINEAEKRGLSWFGIRHHHKVVAIGDDLGNSYNTIDDNDAEKLSGICCLGFDVDEDSVEFLVNELKENNYQKGSIVLVGGTAQEYGNDDNEVVIENAEVLAIIE